MQRVPYDAADGPLARCPDQLQPVIEANNTKLDIASLRPPSQTIGNVSGARADIEQGYYATVREPRHEFPFNCSAATKQLVRQRNIAMRTSLQCGIGFFVENFHSPPPSRGEEGHPQRSSSA